MRRLETASVRAFTNKSPVEIGAVGKSRCHSGIMAIGSKAKRKARSNSMKKAVLLAVLATATVACATPSDAATKKVSSGNSVGTKMKDGAKAVGRGIMWGPKKVGNGLKKMNDKLHGNKSK
jgi:hypothetical protein